MTLIVLVASILATLALVRTLPDCHGGGLSDLPPVGWATQCHI